LLERRPAIDLLWIQTQRARSVEAAWRKVGQRLDRFTPAESAKDLDAGDGSA
jgi:hypothetical protein